MKTRIVCENGLYYGEVYVSETGIMGKYSVWKKITNGYTKKEKADVKRKEYLRTGNKKI